MCQFTAKYEKKTKAPVTGQAGLSVTGGRTGSIYIKMSKTNTSKINKTKIRIMESATAIFNAPICTGIHYMLCRADGKGNLSG
jgi:hypothetical protein